MIGRSSGPEAPVAAGGADLQGSYYTVPGNQKTHNGPPGGHGGREDGSSMRYKAKFLIGSHKYRLEADRLDDTDFGEAKRGQGRLCGVMGG